MHPKYKRKAAKAKAKAAAATSANPDLDDARKLQARKFPGLSVPDQDWISSEKYAEERARMEPEAKLPASISMDGTMAELAAVAGRRTRAHAEDFIEAEPSHKRARGDERADFRRSYEGPRDNGYGSRQFGNGSAYDRGRPPAPSLDERPVLYRIYNGTVQNIRDFGAFVSLDGVQGRTEGE